MSDASVYEDFLLFEREYNLFEIAPEGYPIWERIRGKIFNRVLTKQGIFESSPAAEGSDIKYHNALWCWLRNGIVSNPFLVRKHDILFHGHPRRKRLNDGMWWDIYCDPIHLLADIDSLHLESPREMVHDQPPRTPNIRYTDFLELSGSILRQCGIGKRQIEASVRGKLKHVERSLRDRFGVDVNLVNKAKIILEERATTKPLYKLLLRHLKPELAVVVVSYGLETFIEACKELDIPVAELQHGVINEQHLAYSFPGNRMKGAFPDYLFTWGDFWNRAVEYPIPEDHLIPVGYPFLGMREREYQSIEKRDEILFLSQEIIGQSLSRFAVEVSESTNFEITYKLHPDESDRWRSKYPWLLKSDVTVVSGSAPPLYELFARASVQVGVGSTAVFEGLVFNLQTFIYNLDAAYILQPLVDNGTAKMVDSPNDLLRQLDSRPPTFDRDQYFAPKPIQRFQTACSRIINDEI